MGKTIIERMCSIEEKLKQKRAEGCSVFSLFQNHSALKRFGDDLSSLCRDLSMTPVQVILLTAIIQKSPSYRLDAEDIANYLGMPYLRFLLLFKDVEALKRKGYIRITKEGIFRLPGSVLRSLTENKAVVPEPSEGLNTSLLLTRIRRILSVRADDEMTTAEAREEIDHLMMLNADTSLGRTYSKYLLGGKVEDIERLVFAALLYRYYYQDDDQIEWGDIDSYFEEDEMDYLRGWFSSEMMDLQTEGIIVFTGADGILTKEYFKIKDDIKNEALADVGGLKKKSGKITASRKIEYGSITPKELVYGQEVGEQVERLGELMGEDRFLEIRLKMMEMGHRTGFTCLFYGAPGTGKTETVYQLARRSGRDLFVVDVSQIKNCFVGESEKNIKDVFDKYRQTVRAGDTVPILLFNEADAIFGIRSEGAGHAVDKMENSIQNIILQEMEDLDGILIATTNLTCNLDKAFERRFLYKIRFEKPSVEARASIWKSMIPALSPEECSHLAASFDFSGGQIENVARKRAVQSLLAFEDPSFEDVCTYCREETIDDGCTRRKIGY